MQTTFFRTRHKMLSFITFAAIILQVHSGLITHGDDGKATSYQSIHIEHFHPVPTHAKKEFKHLLEHPISIGQSSSNLEVHHGDKHDLGYAIVDSHSKFHVHDEHQPQDVSGHQPQAQYIYYTPKSLEHSDENLVYKSAGYPADNSVHAEYQHQEEEAGGGQDDDDVKIYFKAHAQAQDDGQQDHIYHQYYSNGYAHQQEHSSEQ